MTIEVAVTWKLFKGFQQVLNSTVLYYWTQPNSTTNVRKSRLRFQVLVTVSNNNLFQPLSKVVKESASQWFGNSERCVNLDNLGDYVRSQKLDIGEKKVRELNRQTSGKKRTDLFERKILLSYSSEYGAK